MLVVVIVSAAAWISTNTVAQTPNTPCPDIFQYVLGPDNIWRGQISIRPPPQTAQITVRVHEFLTAALPSKYVGQLNLIDDINILARNILAGGNDQIRYEVLFPLTRPLPTIDYITVNQDIICKGPTISAPFLTKISLEHTVTASNIRSAGVDNIVPVVTSILPQVGGQECGRTLTVAALITHGQNTSRGQWPWHAALYQNKGADLKYICGGTLVGPKHVITAAHCVTRSTTGRALDPDTIIAYLGKYHLHRWANEEGVQQGKVVAIHVHPDYNVTDFRGDLALLEFSTALTYTQYIRHVCLWGREDSNELKQVVGQKGFVVGWGYNERDEPTEELRQATMPIVDQQTCIRSYPEFFLRFTNSMTFCAGYKNGTSACNGDSGGGLVLPRQQGSSKVWYIRGLVSNGVPKDGQRVCNTDHYVVFTDLAKYRNWIAGIIY